jgi:dTDP-4-amino-4,6-dideoxygalactose transaminase
MIAQGIEVQLGTNALHLEPVFSRMRKTRLVNSTRVYKNALTLPLHSELTREDQERVCSTLDAAIKSVE